MKTGNKIGDTIIVAMMSPNISVYVFINSVYKTHCHINFPVFLQLNLEGWNFRCDLSFKSTHSLTLLYRRVGLSRLEP